MTEPITPYGSEPGDESLIELAALLDRIMADDPASYRDSWRWVCRRLLAALGVAQGDILTLAKKAGHLAVDLAEAERERDEAEQRAGYADEIARWTQDYAAVVVKDTADIWYQRAADYKSATQRAAALSEQLDTAHERIRALTQDVAELELDNERLGQRAAALEAEVRRLQRFHAACSDADTIRQLLEREAEVWEGLSRTPREVLEGHNPTACAEHAAKLRAALATRPDGEGGSR